MAVVLAAATATVTSCLIFCRDSCHRLFGGSVTYVVDRYGEHQVLACKRVVKIDQYRLLTDLFHDNLNRTAVFALAVKRHTCFQLDTRKLLFRHFLLRFVIILTVRIDSFDQDITFFADCHVLDAVLKPGDDLAFTEHKYQRRTADIAVYDGVAVTYFILK